MIDRWNNATSKGFELNVPVWRTRAHQWDLSFIYDRVHLNGNFRWLVDLCRCGR